LENFRSNLLAEGISARASDFIVKSIRRGTVSNYELSWGKWVRWCGEQQVDPYGCNVNFVLDFLAFLYEQKV